MQVGLEAPINLYPTSRAPSGPAGASRSPSTAPASATLWAELQRGRRAQPVRVGPHADDRRGDPRAVGDEPHGRLPVHQGDELELGPRPGGRAHPVLGRRGRAARRRARPLGVPVVGHRRPRHEPRVQPGRALRVPGDPHRRPAGAGSWPASRVDDVAHVDLYSCFPSAVQIGATELGLGLDRQLTVTGGLTFAGGPLNNYVMHSIATMVGVLRERSRRGRAVLGERRVRHQARLRHLLRPSRPPARLPARGLPGRDRPLPDPGARRRLHRRGHHRGLHGHARRRGPRGGARRAAPAERRGDHGRTAGTAPRWRP